MSNQDLLDASEKGDLDTVKRLLSNKAIDYAIEKNHPEIVELLSKGPKTNEHATKGLKEDKKKGKEDKKKGKEEELREKENENEQLKEENAILRKENDRLKEENSTLKEENSRLKGENKEAGKQNEENSTLREEVQRLKEKNNDIAEQNERYLSYLSALKEKIRELTFFDFSEYEEERNIGEGGTSKVKIVHKKEAEKYAMKELLLFDHKSMQQFLFESELLFKLRHPSIVRVYGFSYGDKTHKPSIIMSLEPTSLEESIKNKEVEEGEKNRIVVELVLGMRFIHKHKIMHRDLKPMNILLSKNKHVRITDFGLAKEEDLETSQTKGVGTLRFMAPELFDSEAETSYTNKVDVYSFGIILIYIVTDEYPVFNLSKVVNGVPPKLPKNISNWVRELIISCLSKSPENRPTFAEIFENMKANNFDLFSDSKDKKLTSKQRSMKKHIESRITKIEAFEFQHQ